MASRRRLSAVSAPMAAAAAATTIAIIIIASSTSTSAFAPPPPSSSSLRGAGWNGIGRHRGHRDATTTVPNRAAMVPEWLAFDAAAATTATMASTAITTAMTTTMAEHQHPASLLLEAFSSPAATTSALSSSIPPPPSFASSSDLLLSFSDQGQNLAGTFFQLSLLPYLAFLYFLGFRGNRTPDLGKFGFAYLLLFVGGTIPSGIITKGAYGLNLANVDWIHGGAEALLTITNVLIVLGFREAMTNPDYQKSGSKFGIAPKVAAGSAVALFALACAFGTKIGGFEAHSPFLYGIGNLPEEAVLSLPFVMHSEPDNALSIPTWAIHFSSVFEFVFAMDVIWRFAETTGNSRWKGMTWGMIPLHASGICACTHHFFYNPTSLQFVVELQAFFTLLGNITVAIAAYRIAISNGWTLRELNPLPRSRVGPESIAIDELAMSPYAVVQSSESELQLAGKLLALTIACSYVLKYGELGLDLPLTENGIAAGAIVLGVPAVTSYLYYKRGQEEGGEGGFSLPAFGGKGEGEGGGVGLSMADVKKFGVSGTVAYILTELAFWAVAFPVASTALYRTTGHWPDVINDVDDRTAVLAFVFAGANIARLLVPLRLGAALALAPWVDENIVNREGAAGKQP